MGVSGDDVLRMRCLGCCFICVGMVFVLSVSPYTVERGLGLTRRGSSRQDEQQAHRRRWRPPRSVSGGGGGSSGHMSSPKRGVEIAYEPWEQYKSQHGQDKWANEHVFGGHVHGVFVDLGCYDGVTYSNTWYFERVLNWTGVCVEPNPEVYPRIATQAGRASGVQVAVSNTEGSAPFVAAFMRSSLNASAVDYEFLQAQGVAAQEVRVRVTTPSALLGHHLPRDAVIDYVNIDVEQQEIAILAAWPFERHCVQVFNIENEPPKGGPSLLPQLSALLAPRGYAHRLRLGVDEVFVRKTPCRPTYKGNMHHTSHGNGGASSRRRRGRRALQKRRLATRGADTEVRRDDPPPEGA